ncbi:pre-mRNA-splicing factor CWC22-like protein [Senna tora]|uniref:Pre-mRNA-splicing factor CWC22-like protein n=1 Tax=Senna tora TaxID=362788 RepID=A0A834WCM5_9FABA|nr:pre-mRNA-splicing factor CWC22-like protein [Senna tora]
MESYHREKIRAEPDSVSLKKGDYDENEQHERSGITEEHDQPFPSHEQCCLSDSTQSSNKRKRSNSPSSNDQGTIFKIRLPLRKQRESVVSRLDDQSGSTLGSIGAANSLTKETCRQSDSKEFQNLMLNSAGVVDRNTGSIDNEIQRMASAYNSMFQNLFSYPPQCEGIMLEDEDWLFASERREKRPLPKEKSVNDALWCSNPTLWPGAQYLPEVDIYALPYAVPF